VDHEDANGATALHKASAVIGIGGTECVEFLLDNGASIAAADKAGATALHIAALAGVFNTVQLLLRRGALLDVRSLFFHTHARQADAGIHPDQQARDEDGRTCLHKAAYAGETRICQQLIKGGASLSAT